MKDEISNETISDLERKELENLGFYSDEEENNINDNNNIDVNTKDIINQNNNNNNNNKNKTVSIFKSTDFNDFPKSDLKENIQENNNINNININNNKHFIKKNIKINKNKIEDNKIDEIKNEEMLEEDTDEEKSISNNSIKDIDDIDNEINLEEQLKKEYEGDYFKDNEKIKGEISDTELFSMSKENIIQYKNYQILKLKTVIKNLKQEKEALIQNYKQTTDNLLKHIKELEFKGTGERPVTAKIIHKISSNNQNDEKKTGVDKDKCPNCGKKIKNNLLMEHSLECMRKKYRCIYCNDLMNVEDKIKHNNLFSDKALMYKNIINKNSEYVIKALKHYFPINEIILDEKTGDYFIHLIIKNNIFNVIKKYDNVIDVNLENKQKETPLFLAVNKNDINIVKDLICKGADIKRRNKSDMSPLMLCCKNNYQTIAEFLIKKGADVNEKNILGDTPLKLAQSNGNEELALKLIKIYKADIN